MLASQLRRRRLLVVVVVVMSALATSCSSVPAASPSTVAGPGAAEPPTLAETTPDDYGAVGDGTADDTGALQSAFDAMTPGSTLTIPAGKVYRHSAVVTISVPGSRVTGAGVLLASAEETSSVLVDADDVTLDGGLVLRMGATTQRWFAYEQMKLRTSDATGITLRGIHIEGSAAAGIYLGSTSNFLVEDVTVQDSRADGIHMTTGTRDGVVRRPVVRNPGDDGVASVSYSADGAANTRISVESPRFFGSTLGRAYSVVGGTDHTLTDLYAEGSSSAALYIANEGAPFFTAGVARVSVDGAELIGSNTSTETDHGAVLVYSARAGYSVDDVTISNVSVRDTRPSASRNVGVVSDGGAVNRLTMQGFRVDGGPPTTLAAGVPSSSYSSLGWTRDATPVPDHIGYVAP